MTGRAEDLDLLIFFICLMYWFTGLSSFSWWLLASSYSCDRPWWISECQGRYCGCAWAWVLPQSLFLDVGTRLLPRHNLVLEKHFSFQEGAEPLLVVVCPKDPVTAAQRAGGGGCWGVALFYLCNHSDKAQWLRGYYIPPADINMCQCLSFLKTNEKRCLLLESLSAWTESLQA